MPNPTPTECALNAAIEWINAAPHGPGCAVTYLPVIKPGDSAPLMAIKAAQIAELTRKPMPCDCWKAEALAEVAELRKGKTVEITGMEFGLPPL